MDIEDVESYRSMIPMPDDKWRDRDMEQKFMQIAEKISRDEGAPPPEIVVVPDFYVAQVSDGGSDLATYKSAIQRIYIEPNAVLFDLCHEMGHHINAVKEIREGTVEEGLKEWRESMSKPWSERKREKNAEDFALHCTVKYRDDWAKLFGEGRFMPWQRKEHG